MDKGAVKEEYTFKFPKPGGLGISPSEEIEYFFNVIIATRCKDPMIIPRHLLRNGKQLRSAVQALNKSNWNVLLLYDELPPHAIDGFSKLRYVSVVPACDVDNEPAVYKVWLRGLDTGCPHPTWYISSDNPCRIIKPTVAECQTAMKKLKEEKTSETGTGGDGGSCVVS